MYNIRFSDVSYVTMKRVVPTFGPDEELIINGSFYVVHQR